MLKSQGKNNGDEKEEYHIIALREKTDGASLRRKCVKVALEPREEQRKPIRPRNKMSAGQRPEFRWYHEICLVLKFFGMRLFYFKCKVQNAKCKIMVADLYRVENSSGSLRR